MKRGESKAAILAAARGEFASHGYAGARVDRIATKAGVNKQLIYYYFGSKANLHGAATARAADPLSPAKGRGAPESLRRIVLDVVASLAARPEVVALLVDPNPAPEARARAREWLLLTLAAFRSAVSAAQGLGHARDDVDPDRAARQALILCVGSLALREHLGLDPEAWARDIGDTVVRVTAW